jgi:uncharacterized protein (DUF305 family)
MNTRLFALPAIALLLPIAMTGCTAGVQQNSMMGDQKMPGEGTVNFSGSDIMFAQMMIPHHQQAVDMGTLAETRASSPEVKELAAKIKAEQAPEIEQMKSWLELAGASEDMGHDMGMGGMLTDEQMSALTAASGAEFDRLYLEGMIGHHQGAIHMAQMVIDSNNAEAKALGEAIISSQTEQIDYMHSLLNK